MKLCKKHRHLDSKQEDFSKSLMDFRVQRTVSLDVIAISPGFVGHCICRILDNFASASARNGGATRETRCERRFNDSRRSSCVRRETKARKEKKNGRKEGEK